MSTLPIFLILLYNISMIKQYSLHRFDSLPVLAVDMYMVVGTIDLNLVPIHKNYIPLDKHGFHTR